MSGPGIDFEYSRPLVGRIGISEGSKEKSDKRLLRHIGQLRKTVDEIHAGGVEFQYRCTKASFALEKALDLDDDELVRSWYGEINILCTKIFKKKLEGFLPQIKESMARDSLYLPRVCIKGSHDEKTKEMVGLICRDTPYTYRSLYQIKENTGFRHVNTTGNRYLENDIPKKVIEGGYENPRIDKVNLVDFAKAHEQYHTRFQSVVRRFGAGSRLKDRYENEWKKIWKSYDESGNSVKLEDIDCYKSTLIIPVTLNQADTSSEFDLEFF